MKNEEIKKAFDFELQNSNEPLYSDEVLKFVKNYHKKTKPEKDKFINSYQNNILELVSEIDFAFNELIEKDIQKENNLYRNLELNEKNINKREKLIKKIELLTNSKTQWLKDAKNYIKIEAPETKEINNLNYPDFFKNHEAFLIFVEFIENDIADPLTDFSFIFQNLKHDNYIHDIKQKTFYNWLFEDNYIKQQDINKILENNGFKAKNKCNSEKRLNKYLRLTEKYFNTDSE